MSVRAALFRIYRPVLLWYAAVMGVVGLAATTAIAVTRDVAFSPWLLIFGSAARYWLLVVAVLVVTMQFRLVVSAGITRREFLTGAAALVLSLALVLTVVAVAGHAAEWALLGHRRSTGYPGFTAAGAAGEFGRILPTLLAYAVAGSAVAAVFHRFNPWIGVISIVPGLVPIGLAGTLAVNEHGTPGSSLNYGVALALCVAGIAFGGAATWLLMRDTPLRRTA